MSPPDSEEVVAKKKTRRNHNKVRSGCLTCKTRRKKCDETKPCCLRCTSTGRKCDGYTSVVTSSTTPWEIHTDDPSITQTTSRTTKGRTVKRNAVSVKNTTIAGVAWTIRRQPTNCLLATDVESSCFDYFKLLTGPQIGAYHDSSMWNDFVVRASLLHPVVMKAAAAVGAAHRRFDLGISREAFEYCAIADRLFEEAKNTLQSFKRDEQSCQYAAEIIAVVEFLYGIHELFQNNHREAACHVAEGLSTLWSKPRRTAHSESRYRYVDARPDLFPQNAARLEAYATQVLSRGPKILTDVQTQLLPQIPAIFQSLEEGLDLMFTQLQHILHTPASIWADREWKTELQTSHVHHLLEWNAAFAETIKRMTNRTPRQTTACLYLRRIRNMTYLLLYLIFYARDDKHRGQQSEPGQGAYAQETDGFVDHNFDGLVIENGHLWELINSHEDLVTNIARVQFAIDELLDAGSKFEHHPYTTSMNPDTGMGPPRSSSPGPEGSAKTRHLVRSLLDPLSREKLHQRSTASSSQPIHGACTPSEVPHVNTPTGCNSDMQLQGNAYSIAEQLCSIEEHAIYAAVQRSDVVPRDVSPMWFDVTCFLEERKMLFRYCSRDNSVRAGLGRGMVWTQEWVRF